MLIIGVLNVQRCKSMKNVEFLPENNLRQEINNIFTDIDALEFVNHEMSSMRYKADSTRKPLIEYTKFAVWILEKNRRATAENAYYYKFWNDTELYMRDALDSMIREEPVYSYMPVRNYQPECQYIMEVDDYGNPSVFSSFESLRAMSKYPPAASSSLRRNRSSQAASSSSRRNRSSPAASPSLRRNRSL